MEIKKAMKKLPIFSLPYPSTDIANGTSYRNEGGDLLLSMDFYENNNKHTVNLRFVKERAFRGRSEIYCTTWHIDDVYDTVCEVQGSKWVKELLSDCASGWEDEWVMRHFMIYIDSFGCIEVVAESVEMDHIESKIQSEHD